MIKADVIELMNRDHLEKVQAFNRMTAKQQRRTPVSFWSEHDCQRYAWAGFCQECGQAVFQIACF